MAKFKRVRAKPCSQCTETNDVLYRVRVEEDGDWIFDCRACLDRVKPGKSRYQYRGIWKSKKRH